MATTLTAGSTTVALPDDLQWSDEYDWHPVQQTLERSLTGAALIDVTPMAGGRPISLRPPDNAAAWITRAVLDQLQTWAAVPGLEMVLDFGGVQRDVIWRHHEPPALAAEPVVHYSDIAAGDFYLVKFRFTEV